MSQKRFDSKYKSICGLGKKTKCFQYYRRAFSVTFVFALEFVARKYYDYRTGLMERTNKGLTDTYNAFHDSECGDLAIVELRRLHDEMDRAVLEAYGWTDIRLTCEFILDYDDDEDEIDDNESDENENNEVGLVNFMQAHLKICYA